MSFEHKWSNAVLVRREPDGTLVFRRNHTIVRVRPAVPGEQHPFCKAKP